MITNVSLVSVWVKDLDESLAFYTDVLGFAAGDDITLGEDFRWVTVTHPSQPELQLHLTTPSKPLSDDLIAAMQRAQAEGGLPGVGLHVDDCRKTVEALKAKGVEFLQEPEERPHGVEALMRDNSGNWKVLVEPREFTPEDFEGVTFDRPLGSRVEGPVSGLREWGHGTGSRLFPARSSAHPRDHAAAA